MAPTRVPSHLKKGVKKNNLVFSPQGPGTFEKSELPILSDGVDWAFFARKFNVDLDDEVRSEVLEWLHSDDYNQKVLGPFKDWLLKWVIV